VERTWCPCSLESRVRNVTCAMRCGCAERICAFIRELCCPGCAAAGCTGTRLPSAPPRRMAWTFRASRGNGAQEGNSWPPDNSEPSFSGEVTDDGLDSRFLEGTKKLEIGDGEDLPGVLL
jgi:hypothetical protein